MPDESTRRDSAYLYARLTLKERLKVYWHKGMVNEFCAAVIEELAPKVIKYLRNPTHYIKNPPFWFRPSHEECEDLFHEAVEKILEIPAHEHKRIRNPEGYIYQIAKNAARGLYKEGLEGRGVELKEEITPASTSESSDEGQEQPAVDNNAEEDIEETSPDVESEGSDIPEGEHSISQDSAAILIEGIKEDIEAVGEPWAVKVVQEAVSRLNRPKERLVIKHLLENGFDYPPILAANELGMKSETYRGHKSKGLKTMRKTIPAVIKEKGISPRHPEVFDIFTDEMKPFPSEEGTSTLEEDANAD